MDITQIYNNIFSEWNGKRYGDTTLIAEGVPASEIYQCVSFIKIVLAQEYGIQAGAWGNATKYATNTNSAILAKFQKLGTTNLQIGDFVVLGFDHIGIANGVQSATTYEQLDQNGGKGTGTGTGPDAIQVHTFQKKDIIGVLRPIGATVGPAYTITPMDPRNLHVTPSHSKWNLALPDFNDVAANPVGNSGGGYDFTAVATLKHHDPTLSQYTYYLENAGVPQGWNALDCVQAAQPAAAPAMPTLASPGAAPLPFPGDTTPYNVVVDCPGYSTSNDAANNINRTATVQKGNYYIFNKRYSTADPTKLIAINVTKTVGKSFAWINPTDNQVTPYTPPPAAPAVAAAPAVTPPPAPKAPVVPASNVTDNTWKKTLTPLLSTSKPIYFKILRNSYVHDMNDGTDAGIELHESDPTNKNTWLPIKYWMTRSNMLYLVPFLAKDLDINGKPLPGAHYYAIPTSDIDSGAPLLESELSNVPAENARQYRKDQGRSTTSDDLFYAGQKIAKLVSDGVRFLDGIIPVKVSLKKKN